MKRAALVFAIACSKSPSPAPIIVVIDASEPSFDAGAAPTNRALFVVAEGSQPISLSRQLPNVFRHGQDVFEVNGSSIVRRKDLPLEWTQPTVPEGGRKPWVVATAMWKDGSVLELLHTTGNRFDREHWDFGVVHGTAVPPVLGEPPVLGWSDMDAASSGEIFAVFDDGITRFPATGVRIDDKAPTRKGRDAPRVHLVHVRDASDVWVAGFDSDLGKDSKQRPYLAHFDGHAWTAEEVPGETFVGAVASGPDGTIWIATDMLRWRDPSGKWHSSSTPTPADFPSDLHAPRPWIERDGLRAVGPGDVWMTIRYGTSYLLVHTSPGDGVLDLDDGHKLTFAQAGRRWFLPAAW